MDTKQNELEESQGMLYNLREELPDETFKKCTELLNYLTDVYDPKQLLEILELIYDLKFRVDSNNYCYDENLSFDLADVKRGIEREYKLKKAKTDVSIYNGGRPSIIKEWIGKYVKLKEGYNYEFHDETEYWNVAKFRLSRTTFWRLRKKIK